MWIEDKPELKGKWLACFVFQGGSSGCHLFSTASMLEWLRNLLPHHSQGSSMERWSRKTLRVVTARVFYVLRGSLTSPFIFNNSVETAVPFNVVSTQDVVSWEINFWKVSTYCWDQTCDSPGCVWLIQHSLLAGHMCIIYPWKLEIIYQLKMCWTNSYKIAPPGPDL